MNRLELRNHIKSADGLNMSRFSDAEINQALIDTNDQIVGYADWPQLQTVSTLNLGTGNNTATLPTGFRKALEIISSNYYFRVGPLPLSGFRQTQVASGGVPGRPIAWYPFANKMEFAPKADQPYSLLITYIKNPGAGNNFTSDSDVPFADAYHLTWAFGAAASLALSRNDYVAAEKWQQTFANQLEAMKNRYLPQLEETMPEAIGEPYSIASICQNIRGEGEWASNYSNSELISRIHSAENQIWSKTQSSRYWNVYDQPVTTSYDSDQLTGLPSDYSALLYVTDANGNRIQQEYPENISRRYPGNIPNGSVMRIITSGDTVKIWPKANGTQQLKISYKRKPKHNNLPTQKPDVPPQAYDIVYQIVKLDLMSTVPELQNLVGMLNSRINNAIEELVIQLSMDQYSDFGTIDVDYNLPGQYYNNPQSIWW